MPYIINKSNGTELVILDDGTVDRSTSLSLVGRNYVGYGEAQNENFVFLLENFCNDTPPSTPVVGQTWFDTTNHIFKIYNGIIWHPVGSAVISEVPPDHTPSEGYIWFDSSSKQLYIYQNDDWQFIGPEAVANFGTTKARSTALTDSDGVSNAVILLTVDDIVIGICTKKAFTISPITSVFGFNNLTAGITLSEFMQVKGRLDGTAAIAVRLETARTINGIGFDGQSNITITANTTKSLGRGAYLTGSNFNGSQDTTWSIDATPTNTIGTVVARNSLGGFEATEITANIIGNVTGNVHATLGTSTFDIITANTFIGATLTGNAFSATQLQTARTINGVAFDGSTNITTPANAQTLTGSYLNHTVLQSSLQSVGALTTLSVTDNKITLGSKTLTTPLSNGTIATQEYVQTIGNNSQGTKTVQSVSAGVPSNAAGVDGDIIYQY